MTTLQEFDKKLKPLIHQAVVEAYLAGKEDERKRVVEMIRDRLEVVTGSVENLRKYGFEERAQRQETPEYLGRKNELLNLIEDLKQSIIK
jgi:hypothetical protein